MTIGEVSMEWVGLTPDNLDAVEQQIQKEIAEMQLINVMDLMFHTVFLSDSLEGPTVFVYPSHDGETLLCEYSPVTEWT
jgi:hypothetical protein